jgi:hypothetical protein
MVEKMKEDRAKLKQKTSGHPGGIPPSREDAADQKGEGSG